MTKGYEGQSCAETIRDFVRNADHPLTYTDIIKGIRSKGYWKDITIWRMLMSNVVNLVPARYEWKNSNPFLFLRPDGRYELFDEKKHPKTIE